MVVVRELNAGVMTNGFGRLIAMARQRYPHNTLLEALEDEWAGQ